MTMKMLMQREKESQKMLEGACKVFCVNSVVND